MAYTFQEYPKWLRFDGKPSVLVKTADEEAAARAEHGGKSRPAARAGKPAAESAGVDRKALIAKAKAAGVKKANFMTTEDLVKLVG